MTVVRMLSGRIGPDGVLIAHGVATIGTVAVTACGYVNGSDESLAAVMADAWHRHRTSIPAVLDGQFAAAFSDSNGAGLVHDALGVVPLFWRDDADTLSFSTRLADLVHPDEVDRYDRTHVARILTGATTTSLSTPWPAIRRLGPGQSLRWERGRATIVNAWDLRRVEPLPDLSMLDVIDRYRSLVDASVASAVDPSAPTWLGLSGGIDSATVAAAIPPGRDLCAYTVVAPGWPEDEAKWAHLVADALDVPLVEVPVDDVLPLSAWPDAPLGEPTEEALTVSLTKRISSLLNTTSSTVALTGRGGDGFVGAAVSDVPSHLADALFNGRPLTAIRSTLRWSSASPAHRPTTYWLRRALFALAWSHIRRRPSLRPIAPWIEPDTALLSTPSTPSDALRCRLPSQQEFLLSVWGAATTVCDPAATTSVVWRHPMLTREIFEFLWALPWQYKRCADEDRIVQRRAGAGRFPDEVRRRVSSPTGSRALAVGLQRSPLIEELFDDSALVRHGYVCGDRWRTALRQAQVGQTHGDRNLVVSLSVECWLRQLDSLRVMERFSP